LQNISVFPEKTIVLILPVLPRTPKSSVSTEVRRGSGFIFFSIHFDKRPVLSLADAIEYGVWSEEAV